MLLGANPLPALVLGYLLVSVGYVFGTIMLIVLAGRLPGRLSSQPRPRCSVAGARRPARCSGLVALTVYLPGVLTASVTARATAYGTSPGKFTTDPLALFASVLPTGVAPVADLPVLPYAYVPGCCPSCSGSTGVACVAAWRPLGGLLLFTVVTLAIVDGPAELGPLRWPLRLQPFLVLGVCVLLVVAWYEVRGGPPVSASPVPVAGVGGAGRSRLGGPGVLGLGRAGVLGPAGRRGAGAALVAAAERATGLVGPGRRRQ